MFKKKEDILGVENARYKARIVAKGYIKILGVEFTNVFSLAVKHSAIRALFEIVVFHDYPIK